MGCCQRSPWAAGLEPAFPSFPPSSFLGLHDDHHLPTIHRKYLRCPPWGQPALTGPEDPGCFVLRLSDQRGGPGPKQSYKEEKSSRGAGSGLGLFGGGGWGVPRVPGLVEGGESLTQRGLRWQRHQPGLCGAQRGASLPRSPTLPAPARPRAHCLLPSQAPPQRLLHTCPHLQLSRDRGLGVQGCVSQRTLMNLMTLQL